jgi:hypothetical protein
MLGEPRIKRKTLDNRSQDGTHPKYEIPIMRVSVLLTRSFDREKIFRVMIL